MERFLCNSCSFCSRHFPLLLRHYRVTHAYQYGFRIVCGIDHCQRGFKVLDSYVRHIKHKHANFYEQNMSVRFVNPRPAVGNEVVEHNNDMELDNAEADKGDDSNDIEIDENLSLTDHDYKREIALFLLTLREIKKLPLATCPDVVQEIKNIIQSCKQETSDRLHYFLGRNIELEQDRYEEILHGFDTVETACEHLSSIYKQNAYFRQNFDFIEPEEIVAGKRNPHEKPLTFMYVPINKTLQALLKHEDILAEVVNGHSATQGMLGDFCDGNIFKTHPLFKEDPKALQIQLYSDEFQVVNPLGTKIKKFKLTGVYFILGNLQPHQRSKLHCIQLAILCPTHVIKSFGWEIVLQPLLRDIRKLETDGICIDGLNSAVVRGTVSMLVTDNLAAHSLAGLTESFTAFRNCRFCNITKENMQTEFDPAKLTLRTPETYDQQVNLVQQDEDLKQVYGIKDSSPLNTMNFFHVIGSMPSDIAHDVFEGFGSELMQIVIKALVRDGFFTLSDLNGIIRSFPYAESDKVNKPSTMPEDLSKFRIKQTASQTWCLMRLLPLLIGEKIPEGHDQYSLLTEFLDIVDIICAPVVAVGDAAYLSDLIQKFLSRFFDMCDEVTVKPKAHYLLHYAFEILQFGPLKHCWTLRFEGKHNYFKEAANRTKNKVNICKTLATRHQYMQCLHYASDNFLASGITDTKKGKVFPVRLLHNNIQALLHGVQGDKEVVYQASSANYEGTQYTAGAAVALGYEADTYQFGVIDCFFDLGGSLYILIKSFNTSYFSEHYHSYIIEDGKTWKLLQPKDLFDPYPLGVYTICDQKMVVLKYRIACKIPEI